VSFGQNMVQPRAMLSNSSFMAIPPQGDEPVPFPVDNAPQSNIATDLMKSQISFTLPIASNENNYAPVHLPSFPIEE